MPGSSASRPRGSRRPSLRARQPQGPTRDRKPLPENRNPAVRYRRTTCSDRAHAERIRQHFPQIGAANAHVVVSAVRGPRAAGPACAPGRYWEHGDGHERSVQSAARIGVQRTLQRVSADRVLARPRAHPGVAAIRPGGRYARGGPLHTSSAALVHPPQSACTASAGAPSYMRITPACYGVEDMEPTAIRRGEPARRSGNEWSSRDRTPARDGTVRLGAVRATIANFEHRLCRASARRPGRRLAEAAPAT